MTFLPRLIILLLIGVVALLFAGGVAGARGLGLARGAAPVPAEAGQDQPGPTSAAPLAVPAAAQPAPSGAEGSMLPGLPGGGGATGGGSPAAETAQDQPEGAADTAPAAASPAASDAPSTQAAPGAAPPGRIALTTNRRIIGRPADTATVTATVTDATEVPLAGALVTFSLDDGEAGQLSVVQARTDAAGITTTTFAPEIFRGAATISAATEEGAGARVTIRIDCGC